VCSQNGTGKGYFLTKLGNFILKLSVNRVCVLDVLSHHVCVCVLDVLSHHVCVCVLDVLSHHVCVCVLDVLSHHVCVCRLLDCANT